MPPNRHQLRRLASLRSPGSDDLRPSVLPPVGRERVMIVGWVGGVRWEPRSGHVKLGIIGRNIDPLFDWSIDRMVFRLIRWFMHILIDPFDVKHTTTFVFSQKNKRTTVL